MSKKELDAGDMGDMGMLYDKQAEPFAAQAPELLWWQTVGKPAYERHLGEEFFGRSDVQVLDLGCASGRVAQYLIGHKIPPQSITGVDISSSQIEIARQRIPQATFIVGDISKIQSPPNKHDLVVSNMVFEFLNPDELQRTMANVSKTLKPEGTFFLITTHPEKMRRDSGLEKPGVFMVKFPWGGEGPNYYRTLADFRQAIDSAGLKIGISEELAIPPEAEQINPKEHERYAAYPYIRLVVKATKPA